MSACEKTEGPMMQTTIMKAAPRKVESLEKYKTIRITQPGNPEYKRFTELYNYQRHKEN